MPPKAPEGFMYVECLCGGDIESCRHCGGTSWTLKKICPRCHGGKVPGKCVDCRGRHWLDITTESDGVVIL